MEMTLFEPKLAQARGMTVVRPGRDTYSAGDAATCDLTELRASYQTGPWSLAPGMPTDLAP